MVGPGTCHAIMGNMLYYISNGSHATSRYNLEYIVITQIIGQKQYIK